MSGPMPQDPRGNVPADFREAYTMAYRRSLAEHPTEMMLQARPGKRAAEKTGVLAAVVARLADSLLDPRARLALMTVGAVAVIVLAFIAGRLAS